MTEGRICLLHLGMNKTGSTTIQYSLRDYDDGTTRYLPYRDPNPAKLLRAAFFNAPLSRDLAAMGSADAATARSRAREILTEKLGSDGRNIVISSEMLSYLPDERTGEEMVEFLGAHFDRFKAIAYIRDPRSYLPSAFQQDLKQHATRFNIEKLFPKYRDRLLPWVKLLGAENVEFVAFDKEQFHKGSLLGDFCNRMSLEEPAVSSGIAPKNISFSAEAMAVLFLYRSVRGSVSKLPAEHQSRNSKLIVLLKKFGVRKFGFSEAALAPVLERNRDQIEWIQANMVGSLMSDRTAPDVQFSGRDDIIDFATSCLPSLKDWYAQQFPTDKTVSEDVVGILDAAYLNIGLEANQGKGSALRQTAKSAVRKFWKRSPGA